MKVNKLGPTFPIFKKSEIPPFRGSSMPCQPLRNDRMSIHDRNLAETTMAVELTNLKSAKHKYDVCFASIAGIALGVLCTILMKRK